MRNKPWIWSRNITWLCQGCAGAICCQQFYFPLKTITNGQCKLFSVKLPKVLYEVTSNLYSPLSYDPQIKCLASMGSLCVLFPCSCLFCFLYLDNYSESPYENTTLYSMPSSNINLSWPYQLISTCLFSKLLLKDVDSHILWYSSLQIVNQIPIPLSIYWTKWLIASE